MPLDPEIWMPHFKFTLQTISVMYPQHPNDVTKKKVLRYNSESTIVSFLKNP